MSLKTIMADVEALFLAVLLFLSLMTVPMLMIFVGVENPEVYCTCMASTSTPPNATNVTFANNLTLAGNVTLDGNTTSILDGNVTLVRRTVIKMNSGSKSKTALNKPSYSTTSSPSTADMSIQVIPINKIVLDRVPATGVTPGVWLIVGGILMALCIICMCIVFLYQNNNICVLVHTPTIIVLYITFFIWCIVGAVTYTQTKDMCNSIDSLSSLDDKDSMSSIVWLEGITITFLAIMSILILIFFVAFLGVFCKKKITYQSKRTVTIMHNSDLSYVTSSVTTYTDVLGVNYIEVTSYV
jgi:hypothetical protein